MKSYTVDYKFSGNVSKTISAHSPQTWLDMYATVTLASTSIAGYWHSAVIAFNDLSGTSLANSILAYPNWEDMTMSGTSATFHYKFNFYNNSTSSATVCMVRVRMIVAFK